MEQFGFAFSGDYFNFTALVCEEPDTYAVRRWRDHTLADLARIVNPVPWHVALPALDIAAFYFLILHKERVNAAP
jgi:hypothetical protein